MTVASTNSTELRQTMGEQRLDERRKRRLEELRAEARWVQARYNRVMLTYLVIAVIPIPIAMVTLFPGINYHQVLLSAGAIAIIAASIKVWRENRTYRPVCPWCGAALTLRDILPPRKLRDTIGAGKCPQCGLEL